MTAQGKTYVYLYPPTFGAALFWVFTILGPTQLGAMKTEKYLNPPPEHIEYFHFGFRESMADSLWLRWIQDSDSCQTYLKPVEYLPEDARETDTLVPRYKICEQSWSYKMLDAVTRLAPKFEMPYLAGGSTLAILVEDFEGATRLYERGIAEYPDDWQLLYRASFHYQFNLKDSVKAAELLSRAGDLGAPNWVKSLAARLLSESGQYELALRNLLAYRESVAEKVDDETLKKLDKRIQALQAKMTGGSHLDAPPSGPIFKASEPETK